ncbi:MAG TPA: LutB/LldF family L-lactate oxidation iron-sulfur protein [Armatimonadota bacterium]|nr:LutB/LldF family L-lactate oxidation iron-sulfur protein [Armatimonadota bacterium]
MTARPGSDGGPRWASFAQRCDDALLDPFLRHKLRHAMDLAVAGRLRRVSEEPRWEDMRDHAHAIRWHVVGALHTYLEQFIERAEARGAHVHWADDAEQARRQVLAIAREHECRRVLKSKSMVTEEIGLRHALESAGMVVKETDLGELIVQWAGEAPSHLTGPAAHKSRGDIGRLIAEQLGVPFTDDPRALTGLVRDHLRGDFLTADLGISGANFLIAETGSVTIVENEGNARLVTGLAPVHVVVAGIERILPRLADLEVFLQLLAGSNAGQKLTAYTSVITGHRREHEVGGPEHVHVVLVDNGRSRMLADPIMRPALMCIRCAACLNVCPVYRRVGGHAYGWCYPGPIGQVLGADMWSEQEGYDLAFGSTLCGACAEACPVRIDLPTVLLRLRQRAAEAEAPGGAAERRRFRLWAFAMRHPRIYRMLPNWLLRLGMRVAPEIPRRVAPGWVATRDLPEPAPQTFAQRWRSTGGFSHD